MALLDSAQRVPRTRAHSKHFTERQIHPAICLLSGFGVIFGAAALVHLMFKVLV